MKKLSLILATVAVIGLCFAPAWAQDNELDEGVFGTDNQSTWITSWEFDPTVNFGTPFFDFDQYGVFNFYERWSQRVDSSLNNIAVWAAGIRLPDGARLVRARLYAYDKATSGGVFPGTNPGIELTVRRERTFATSAPSPSFKGPVSTMTDSGYTTLNLPINWTIDNTNNFYWVRVDTNATAGFIGDQPGDFRHRLIGVRLLWHRQLQTYSPDIQTFDDVPPFVDGQPNGYYNAVEALYAAGITVGCQGPPNRLFCGETGIPRKELAVWLYKALGLHFGD